jgi:hypothetical protein
MCFFVTFHFCAHLLVEAGGDEGRVERHAGDGPSPFDPDCGERHDLVTTSTNQAFSDRGVSLFFSFFLFVSISFLSDFVCSFSSSVFLKTAGYDTANAFQGQLFETSPRRKRSGGVKGAALLWALCPSSALHQQRALRYQQDGTPPRAAPVRIERPFFLFALLRTRSCSRDVTAIRAGCVYVVQLIAGFFAHRV